MFLCTKNLDEEIGLQTAATAAPEHVDVQQNVRFHCAM
jgi:hypothetical protein